jgi:uncharacterized membrane protein YhaH (DUF805 family)
MNLITGHLTRLFDFTGRENRQPFWLWVLALYIAQTVLGFVVSIPLSMRMTNALAPLQADPTYLERNPEQAGQLMMGAFGTFFRDIAVFVVVASLLHLLLISAAVVRRLHDTNRSGWWAAPVPVLQIATLATYAVALPRFFGLFSNLQPDASPDQMNAAMGAILPALMLAGLLGIIGFVVMIGLIVLLCLRGTVGPNRYGPDLLPPPGSVPVQPVWQPPAAVSHGVPARVVRPEGDPPFS